MSFDSLPNEIYLLVFDYLNPIEIVYSFSNLNKRINDLFRFYSKLSSESIDLTRLNPLVFKDFLSKKSYFYLKQLKSIKLTDRQFESIEFAEMNQLVKLIICVGDQVHLSRDQLNLFVNLKEVEIEKNCLTWSKPFVICHYLKEIRIHLKEHNDLIDLLNNLPVVQLVHVTIDYNVTSCRESHELIVSNVSTKLIDFSYEMNSKYGLLYFVTDYSIIELLVSQLIHLRSLRLYIIGCLNTIITRNRLQNDLLKNLTELEKFCYFIQCYGGNQMKSIEEFNCFKYDFGCYLNKLEDMFYYFTLPFQFSRLDQCVDQYFLESIETNFNLEFEEQLGLNSIKHLDLNCSITLKLFRLLQTSFQCLKSIRLFSSRDETLSLRLSQLKNYEIKSVETLIFDHNCRCQPSFLRFFPNLTELIIGQSLLNLLCDQFDQFDFEKMKSLTVYCFQQHCLSKILSCFMNLHELKLRTTSSDDEGPIRSFVDGRCLHKHRPISLIDTLIQLFQNTQVINRLKYIEIGCFFERDELHLETIISNTIRKYKFNYLIHIESFHSTRCGTAKISFL